MSSTKIFWHTKFRRAYDRALLYLLELKEGEVVLLTGASGVGKSEITELLESQHETSGSGKRIQKIRPVLRIQAGNYQDGAFYSIKDMWWRALAEIDHVIVHGNKSQAYYSASELAWAFQNALIAMNTKYLIIDEAQQMRKVRGGDTNARRILDALKSFAAESKVVLVLSGAYPLLATVDLGPHLSRRTHTVVMHRYKSDRSGDLAEFARIVKWCAGVRGLNYDAYIEPLLPEIYLGSLGVFGMVDNLMLELRVEINSRKLRNPDKEFAASVIETFPVKESIRLEIEQGEDYLAQVTTRSRRASTSRLTGAVVKRKKKSRKKRSPVARDLGKSSAFE